MSKKGIGLVRRHRLGSGVVENVVADGGAQPGRLEVARGFGRRHAAAEYAPPARATV